MIGLSAAEQLVRDLEGHGVRLGGRLDLHGLVRVRVADAVSCRCQHGSCLAQSV